LRPTSLPGWDHRNARLASFGTDGWFRSESMAAIFGMRKQQANAPRLPVSRDSVG
jgi:hypothetical protein